MARLSNLNKLFLVPVAAVRSMLADKLGEPETRRKDIGRLRQEELIERIDREETVGERDVEQLYELYRYGRRLSISLFLLPDDFDLQVDDRAIEQTLAELSAGAALGDDASDLNAQDHDDYSTEEINGSVAFCDHVRFGDVIHGEVGAHAANVTIGKGIRTTANATVD